VLGEIRCNVSNTSLQQCRCTNLLCLIIIIIIIIIDELVVCLIIQVYLSACFFSVTPCLSVRWHIRHKHTHTLRREIVATDLAARGDLSYRRGGVQALCQMDKILNKPEICEQFSTVRTCLLMLKCDLLFVKAIITPDMLSAVRIFVSL
jgi:hypothetical protein